MYPILRDTPICHVALTIPDRSLCSKLQGSLSSSQGRRTSRPRVERDFHLVLRHGLQCCWWPESETEIALLKSLQPWEYIAATCSNYNVNVNVQTMICLKWSAVYYVFICIYLDDFRCICGNNSNGSDMQSNTHVVFHQRPSALPASKEAKAGVCCIHWKALSTQPSTCVEKDWRIPQEKTKPSSPASSETHWCFVQAFVSAQCLKRLRASKPR